MYDYVMHFTCECSDASYIGLFNFLNGIRKKEAIHGYPAKSDWHTTYLIPQYLCHGDYPNNRERQTLVSQITQFSPVAQSVNPQRTIIMLTVEIPFNESQLDVFSYRYLVMIIKQLLRPQDFVAIKCDPLHYNKIGSYFILEALTSRKLVAYLTDEKKGSWLTPMPKVVTLSPEWFPAIYLSHSNCEIYEVLNNPLFENDAVIKEALELCKTGNEKNRIDYRDTFRTSPIDKKKYYRGYLRECFKTWINGRIKDFQFTKRLNSVPGIAQLLFAAMYRNLYPEQILLPNAENRTKLENLLEICCDFSDCILQTAENIVSHSKGGVLSIRINNKWDKIADTFVPIDVEPKNSRYLRISLVDFSDNGILDTIQQKTSFSGLTLSHVFATEDCRDDEIFRDYQNFLSRPDHVIHHYGLSVFSNVVKQYEGCFRVSSSASSTLSDAQQYTTEDSKKISYRGDLERPRIPGTEYDILLVMDEKMLTEEGINCNPSLLVTPEYIMKSPTQKIIFTEDIFDFFNNPLSERIKSNSNKYKYQELKEYIVKEASNDLFCKLIAAGGGVDGLANSVFYFFLSNIAENVFGRVEITAKILLQTISLMKRDFGEKLHLYIVLYGLSENRTASFVRQFAMFYHRSEGNQLMQNCQLYIVSEDYRAEVLFAGPRLTAIVDFCKSRRLVSGTSTSISNILEHVSYRENTDLVMEKNDTIAPIPFDLLYRMETCDDVVRLSTHKKWYYSNLITVLNNDIHGKDLGCCLQDVHIRTEKVHLHTFYEGQLLFSNTYWYHVFADYLYEKILEDCCPNKDTKVLLYGYETYSEPMLFATAKKLKERNIPVWYALYENPKYITVAATSEKRIRYLNSFIEQCGEGSICIIYIFGIGTTLATMDQRMNAQLQEAFRKRGEEEKFLRAKKKGYVIIQVRRTNESTSDETEIICNLEKYTVQSTQGYLNFLQEKQCQYLVSVATEWSSTDSCKCCFPETYLSELPLIQTNETSTIPLLLIKPSDSANVRIRFLQEDTYTESFLANSENANYVYYSHLDRSGNHYQFYIRTASLLNDLLKAQNEKLLSWFQQIKEYEFSEMEGNMQPNKISVIVSPLHFSNETFTAAVNQYVFDGKAYIMNFDVKKEFRDSFVAKFTNYRTALEMMAHSQMDMKLELNFYFVDDNIITGATINRARSLVSSMLGEFAFNGTTNVTVNLFKAIIVLLDRNSRSTACNFFDKSAIDKCNQSNSGDKNKSLVLPFYRFIHLNTPSIRSYGDSCPLCSKVEKLRQLERESSLTFVEQHWQKKADYHALKKLSDAKKDKEKINEQHKEDKMYQTRGFRRLQCSEWIWSMLKREKINNRNAKKKLEEEINKLIGGQKSNELKIEYLISFLKVISREHIVYQEGINTAALQILLAIFSLFVKDGAQKPTGLYDTILQLIDDSYIRSEQPQLLYELYQIVIARLCSMGSMLLCREEQLEACLTTGFSLESLCMEHSIYTQGEKNEIQNFSVFLCIQMKKMLFATKDCDMRIKKLRKILRRGLQEGDIQHDRLE